MENFHSELLMAERALLYTMGCNLLVDQPIKVFTAIQNALGLKASDRNVSESVRKERHALCQSVLRFINDRYRVIAYPRPC
jgi:hypothetical protein